MLSDVTMGQFFPGKSVMHRLDPRIKMCLTVYFIVLIFCSKNFVTLGATILMSLLGVVLSKVPLKLYLKSMKPILFIVVFTGVLNLFYGTGDPIFTLGFIHITRNGIVNSIMIAVRIVVLILISSILTFTTSPTQLTDAIERLLKPLALLHVPVHEFAMMMTIALRFVPTLLEETEKIMAAQKARGADMESGGLMQRIKALIPVLVLATLAFAAAACIKFGTGTIFRLEHVNTNPLMPTWLVASLTFVAYNLLGGIGIMAPIGKLVKKRSVIYWGITLAGVMLTVVAASILFSMAVYPAAIEAELPMVAVATAISPMLGTVYGIVLLLSMFCNALASLVAMLTYMEQKQAVFRQSKK